MRRDGRPKLQGMEQFNSLSWKVENAKKRCERVAERIESLPLAKITHSCKQTLLRLVNSEIKFLTRSSLIPLSPISVNVGYLESIVHILQQPSVTGISRVCKPIPLSSTHGKKHDTHTKHIHVDIVCTLNKNPVWFLVSDRNPMYISWLSSGRNKGLRARIEQLLPAAQSYSTMKPVSIIFFFSNGLERDVSQKLGDEFGASEFPAEFPFLDCGFSEELDDGWVNLVVRSYTKAHVFQIRVDCSDRTVPRLNNVVQLANVGAGRSEISGDQNENVFGDKFYTLLSKISLKSLDLESTEPEALLGQDLLNFDTTALIALVSGISNGGTGKLLATPEIELRKQFKCNYEFVIAQVMSELENPIVEELTGVISGKICMICDSVCLEFKELVSMCGGPNEKSRADRLLKCLVIVLDCPSARMMSIPTTRKIAQKNKIVFGTGDHWHAPTLTANMGFVRAISQTGMSLLTVEHKPRALTGD